MIPLYKNKLKAGLHVLAGGTTAHLKISKVSRNFKWALQIDIMTDVILPEKGKFKFNTMPDISFSFRTVSDSTANRSIIIFCTCENLTPEQATDNIKNSSRITCESNIMDCDTYQIMDIGSVDRIMEEGYIITTDFMSSMQADIETYMNASHLKVMKYIPILNNINSTQFNDLLYVHSTTYFREMKNDEDKYKIKIVNPVSSYKINNLWVSLDNTNMFCMVKYITDSSTENSKISGLKYLTLEIATERGEVPKIQNEGKIFFYRKFGQKFVPAKLGYDMIAPMVSYTQPQLYHSDICDMICNEMELTKTVLNQNIIEFFIAKSRSYMLFQNSMMLKELTELNIKKHIFNLSIVISDHNEDSLIAYSPLLKNVILSCDVDRHSAESYYKKGEYVIIEKSSKITHCPSMERRMACLGYKIGAVIHAKGDAFIQVNGESNDYFYPKSSIPKLRYGDLVTFFPSANVTYQGESENKLMAIDAKVLRSRTDLEGVVTKVERVINNSNKELIVLHGKSGNKVNTIAAAYDSKIGQTIKDWEIGAKFNFFISSTGKWQLILPINEDKEIQN